MNVREFYKVTGANYESVLYRLGDRDRIYKTLLDFSNDISYDRLALAISNKDVKSAFTYAQNLKKLALNLALDKLYKRSYALAEVLSEGKIDTLLFERVSREYNKIMDTFRLVD